MIPHEDKLIVAKHVIKFLNEAFEADPVAIHAMICHKMPCNDKLKNHPSIQVDLSSVTDTPYYNVNFMGILNGILDPLINDFVQIKWEEVEDEGRFKIVGFELYSGRDLK